MVNRRKEVRIDLMEVNLNHDRLDSGGPVIGGSLSEHPPLYHSHLEDTVMLTVEEAGDRMVTPHLAPNRRLDGARSHINPSQH